MSPRDVYSVLGLLLKGQESGVRLLKFSIGDTDTEEEVNEQESDELLDPDRSTALRSDAGINAAELDREPVSQAICKPASRGDKGDYIDGIGLWLPGPSLPLLPAPITPAPVIGPVSPPPSESTIKAAIENVAKADYLSISGATATRSPNQALQPASQQSGKAKTGSSSSKKRNREDEGGPNDDKKMKKKAVPVNRVHGTTYPTFFLASLIPP